MFDQVDWFLGTLFPVGVLQPKFIRSSADSHYLWELPAEAKESYF